MKKLYIFLLICFPFLTSSQDEAMDFTKDDCDGNPHHLFSELEEGYVIILEFVMIPNCEPCIDAAGYIQQIMDAYEISDPGMVRWYVIGFTNSYTCQQLLAWENDNDFVSTAVFDDGAELVDYYGGMGMPTIAVVGGMAHEVFYSSVGFTPSDVKDIESAIDLALETSSVAETGDETTFSIFPNPANAVINIGYTQISNNVIELSLFNSIGEIVFTNDYISHDQNQGLISIPTHELESGMYILEIKDGATIHSEKVRISK